MTIYSIILLIINLFFKINRVKLIFFQIKNKIIKIRLTMIMLSLSRIPPTMGFIIKFIVIYSIIKIIVQKYSIIILIVVASLRFLVYFNLFFKINITINNFNRTIIKIKTNSNNIYI